MRRPITRQEERFAGLVKVFCVLGDERAYVSRSPAMFQEVITRHGIKGAYVPFRVEPHRLGEAMQSLRVLHITGANVTVPYKERVIPHLDIVSEGAHLIGAINTIVRIGDQLKGYNTNAIGFMDTLVALGVEVEEKSALVIGTGGVARAVLFILNWLRTREVRLAGRDEQRTAALAERFRATPVALATLADRPLASQIVVNATAVSGADEAPELAGLVDRLDLPEGELVVDFNYDRPKNFWEALARKHELRYLDGLRPLAHMARRTFALWTGMQVPVEEFLAALERTGAVGDAAQRL